MIAHLAATFVAPRENVVLPRPAGNGKTLVAIALGITAAGASYSVAFDSATGWIARLGAVHAEGNLEGELRRLNRYRLLIISEVGYLPSTLPPPCSSS